MSLPSTTVTNALVSTYSLCKKNCVPSDAPISSKMTGSPIFALPLCELDLKNSSKTYLKPM